MANYAQEKEQIHEQLELAKETLNKLRALTDPKSDSENLHGVQNGESSTMNGESEWDGYRELRQDSDEGASSGVGMESPNLDLSPHESTDFIEGDKSRVARDSLVRVLGLQVSKLEDDLKMSLLSYFEQMEAQKEDLISSFEIMHAQLLRHQESCQQHREEETEKDALIERLKAAKQTLETDVETLKRENMLLKATGNSRPRENGLRGYRIKPGYVEHDDLSETLMKENSRLREMLRKYESNDYARLERKVALQEKLCESYNKDMSSKDKKLNRLEAENKGLHEDMKTLQDEILRVNATRLNSERDNTKLQQELQFSEEQINTLREKLSSSEQERLYLQRCISDANSKANLPELEKGILVLREKCESYRDKLNDKERFLESVCKEKQGFIKAIEELKRELAAVRGEERSLKIENERLQKENADREIDRLSSETTTEAQGSAISKMKLHLHELQGKVDELERQKRQHDDKEAQLSQDVLANLEKYTQVEQQLYLAKKELAQVRGFYESSEEKKRDLLAEAERSKEKISILERRIQSKKVNEEDEQRVSDIEKDVQELNLENHRLKEDYETSKTEIEELEEALQSAREQNSLQRMRLDAHETLMKRKDERIKELQNELLELHNQMDALTDEILGKNRQMEGLRMAKMLLDQELDLLKSGKLPMRSPQKEGAAKDSWPFNPTAGPASPDSGFSDLEREKAIDKLRREILIQNKFHPQQPVLFEENVATNEDSKTKAALALEARRLKETEKRLADVIAENEELKDREEEARSLQLQIDSKLRKMMEENKELREKEKLLAQALKENHNIKSRVENRVQQNNPQQGKLEDILLFVDEPIETAILQPVVEAGLENDVECLESEPDGTLINFADEQDGPSMKPVIEGVDEIQTNERELEGKVRDYEISLAKMAEDKEQLLSELSKTQDDLKIMEKNCISVQENKDNFQKIMQEELFAKEEEVAKLQKELSALCNEREDLKSFVNSSKETGSHVEEELLRAQKIILDFERNQGLSREREQSLQELLHKSEDSNANLQVQLSEAQKQCRNADQDAKNLQQQILHLQRGSAELEQEVNDLQKMLSEVTEKERAVSEQLEKCSDAQEKLQRAQEVIVELERQQEISRNTEETLKANLNQSEESYANLQVQVGEKGREYQSMEQEATALLQEIALLQEGSAELEREVNELREKMAEGEENEQKASESLRNLQIENEHLQEQLVKAKNSLETSLLENKDEILALKEDIREKENQIEQLQDELNLSEQRYSEIKSLSSNNQTEISDLHAELIETKEQFYTVSQEKGRLIHNLKDVEHTIAEQDEKIQALELERKENKKIISEKENKVEDLVDKLEDYESENSKLGAENERLRAKLEEAAETQSEMERLLAESKLETKEFEQQLSAAHESITDLETAFERGEDKNAQIGENLREAKERIAKLEIQLDESQRESRAFERDYNDIEKDLEKAHASLDSSKEKIAALEKKLRAAEESIAELEMARDNGLSNEQFLQQKFANAKEKIDKTEAENNDLKERLTKMERKFNDSLSKQQTLADKKEELEKTTNEIRHELEYEREKRLTLKQKLETRDRDNEVIQRKVNLLEKSKAENEDIQHRNMEEKNKLREELARTKKMLSELEATRENQEENINEMEDSLREMRGKTASLEQRLEDATRDNADLHEELEELNRKLKYTKEENLELEKRWQKQKEISDEFRNNLAEREESALNSNYNRDAAERALQSVKKDLARKEAKLKMQKEHIDDLENESEKVNKKLRETELSYKKVNIENERLSKELADTKAKLAKLEAMYKEKANLPTDSEVAVARVSELQSNPERADKPIRDQPDKLNTAQIKITDLENELQRYIKKHEIKVQKTSVGAKDWRRKSADNLSEYGRPSRARQRPNRSRDSSVDSLRSTQSMFDFFDESSVLNEDRAPSNLSREDMPVESDNESTIGIPVVNVIPCDSVTADRVKTNTPKQERSQKLDDDSRKVSGVQFNKPVRVDTPDTPATEDIIDIIEPHIDFTSPVLENSPGKQTALPEVTEDLFDMTRDLPDFHTDYSHADMTGSPSEKQTAQDFADDLIDGNNSYIDYQRSAVTESPPSRATLTHTADDGLDLGVDDAVTSQIDYEPSQEYQQPLLIKPPSDDLFQFESQASYTSTLTNVTDLTLQSPSPPVFPEQTLLVSFDPLDLPQPQSQDKNDEEILDPFEELMRMRENQQNVDGKATGINDNGDVFFDVTDDLQSDEADVTSNDDVDSVDVDITHVKPNDNSYTNHKTLGDVINSPKESAPGPFNTKATKVDGGQPSNLPIGIGDINHVTRAKGNVVNSQEIAEPGPVPQPRKIKDKLKPALFPRGSKKQKKEITEAPQYSVMIMVDDVIVPAPSDKNSSSTREEKTKKKRKAMTANIKQGDEIFKSPSEIRRELEEASKGGQLKQTTSKQNERKQKQKVTEKKSNQYHIEEKKKEVVMEKGEAEDQDEAMGKGRLQKLIAAFDKK